MIAFLKGILIGLSFLIPGLSGGTMMIVLDVFDEAIHSVNELLHGRAYKLKKMVMIGSGTIVGIALFSPVISFFLTNYRVLTMFFFLGVILSSMMEIVNKVSVRPGRSFAFVKQSSFFVIGVLITVIISLFQPNYSGYTGSIDLKWILILVAAGIPVAVALILPGISTSYLLLTFGIYDRTLHAIKSLDIGFLLPLILGIILGTVLLTGVLEKQLRDHEQASYLVILGFVAGSLVQLLKDFPAFNLIEFTGGLILLAIGYGLVFLLRKSVAK